MLANIVELCPHCAYHCWLQVPQEYQCHIGPDGERRDKFERPELCRG